MFSSVLTNNSNWESFAKNLVTFNFYVSGVCSKFWFFRGDGYLKNQYIGRYA